MALTEETYTERVRYELMKRGVEVSPKVIEATIPLAIEELASRVAMSPKRAYLQKEYTAVDLNSGSADLSALADLRIEHIIRVTHRDGKVGELTPRMSRSLLNKPDGQTFYHGYAVENNRLYARTPDGGEDTPNGTLTILAAFTPILATVPRQLEDDLGMIGVEMAERAQ